VQSGHSTAVALQISGGQRVIATWRKKGDVNGGVCWCWCWCQRDARKEDAWKLVPTGAGCRLAQGGVGLMSGEHMPRESWCWWWWALVRDNRRGRAQRA
jgi:hypothetical protein